MPTIQRTSALNKKIERCLAQYLTQYAEPEIAIAQQLTQDEQITPYQHCLVVPAYDENDHFVQRIQQTFSDDNSTRILLITVINQPDSAVDTSKSQQLWDTLLHSYTPTDQTNNYSNTEDPKDYRLLSINSQIDLLLVDRFHHKIPQQQGVGLARKIGGDIACQLIHDKKIDSLWIHYSDADTHLPVNYFTSLAQTVDQSEATHYSAATYPYTHTSSNNALTDDTLDQATRYYEQHLHYYVDGLKRAGSPYAYHTLGSCIASNAYHYCQARGFPKRSGGEDFYLLNKLAKLGNIVELNSPFLKIESRFSHRVPFGTGPAVEKIVERLQVQNTNEKGAEKNKKKHIDYHPSCFTELATLITHFDHIFDYKKQNTNQKSNQYSTEKKSSAYAHYSEWLKPLNKPLQESLATLCIEKLFAHIDKQIKSKVECHKHCHYWLDGFKTLKLIHLLTEYYPKKLVSYPNNETDIRISPLTKPKDKRPS